MVKIECSNSDGNQPIDISRPKEENLETQNISQYFQAKIDKYESVYQFHHSTELRLRVELINLEKIHLCAENRETILSQIEQIKKDLAKAMDCLSKTKAKKERAQKFLLEHLFSNVFSASSGGLDYKSECGGLNEYIDDVGDDWSVGHGLLNRYIRRVSNLNSNVNQDTQSIQHQPNDLPFRRMPNLMNAYFNGYQIAYGNGAHM